MRWHSKERTRGSRTSTPCKTPDSSRARAFVLTSFVKADGDFKGMQYIEVDIQLSNIFLLLNPVADLRIAVISRDIYPYGSLRVPSFVFRVVCSLRHDYSEIS